MYFEKCNHGFQASLPILEKTLMVQFITEIINAGNLLTLWKELFILPYLCRLILPPWSVETQSTTDLEMQTETLAKEIAYLKNHEDVCAHAQIYSLPLSYLILVFNSNLMMRWGKL